MTRMLRSLIWKEWHEQRWKIAFVSMLLMGFTGIALQTRLMSDRDTIELGTVGAALLLPLLASMDLVAAERTSGSLRMLLGLPLHSGITFTVKILVGILVCVIPLIFDWALIWWTVGSREMAHSEFSQVHMAAIGFGVLTFLWMFCASLGQPSEARAALVSMGVIATWYAITLAESMFVGNRGKPYLSLIVTPFGFVDGCLNRDVQELLLVTGTQLAVLAGLLYWCLKRFTKLSRER